MAKKKQKWCAGDIFLIPLENGEFCFGQVLNLQRINIVCCAIFDQKTDKQQLGKIVLKREDIISIAATTREQLDYHVWDIIGSQPILVPIEEHPNEEFREKDWVGAKHYDAAILEEFCNAFYSLVPWDDWADPNYLDKFLVSKAKKPLNLKFK